MFAMVAADSALSQLNHLRQYQRRPSILHGYPHLVVNNMIKTVHFILLSWVSFAVCKTLNFIF